MVCSGVLRGLLLISLLSSVITIEEGQVDLNALRRIINHIEESYQPDSVKGNIVQYSVAIRVPRTVCESNAQITGLPEREEVVKILNDNSSKSDRVFVKNNLVAARRKGSGSNAVHAERLLLNIEKNIENIQQTPMDYLVRGHSDDCVVFYTYNSPCLDYCLNVQNDAYRKHKCIIPPLRSTFEGHTGPVAFVFNKIYENNTDAQTRQSGMLLLTNVMPLYRCVTGQDCVLCGDRKSNQINAACIAEQ